MSLTAPGIIGTGASLLHLKEMHAFESAFMVAKKIVSVIGGR